MQSPVHDRSPIDTSVSNDEHVDTADESPLYDGDFFTLSRAYKDIFERHEDLQDQYCDLRDQHRALQGKHRALRDERDSYIETYKDVNSGCDKLNKTIARLEASLSVYSAFKDAILAGDTTCKIDPDHRDAASKIFGDRCGAGGVVDCTPTPPPDEICHVRLNINVPFVLGLGAFFFGYYYMSS